MNYLSDCLIFLKNGKIRCKFPNFLTPRLELRPDVCLTQCNVPIQLFLVSRLLFILPNVRRSFFLTVFMTSICSAFSRVAIKKNFLLKLKISFILKKLDIGFDVV